MSKGIIIAIDGPAGSGKSTIAKTVAFKLGYIYIDTGAMYRAITLKALQNNISADDQFALAGLTENTMLCFRYEIVGPDSKVYLLMDNMDVTIPIRNQEITRNVSAVAAVPGVRAALVKLQQKMAEGGSVVMDGRDIGTVVFPRAELKIFLSASVDERAKRRWLELKGQETGLDFEELKGQIQARDHFDSHRETDPLRQAEDAFYIDTTALNIDQVVAKVIELAIQRGARLL